VNAGTPWTDVHEIELIRIHLPLVTPLTSAHGTEATRDLVLVRAAVDGIDGWGECPTLSHAGYSGDTTDSAWSELARVAPDLVSGGGDLRMCSNMAAGSLRDAVLDARLRTAGVRLAEHLSHQLAAEPRGDRVPLNAVSSCQVVGLDEEPSHQEGFTKLKVTPDTFDRVRVLRASAPNRRIAVDANGSFPGIDSIPADFDELRLEYVEQPFAAADLGSHAVFRTRFSTPVALDESIVDRAAARAAIEAEAVDVVSLKPARLGGVEAAAAVRVEADAGGVRCFVGGMIESGIGRATALGLASLVDDGIPTDLGPSRRYFDADVCLEISGTVDLVAGTEMVDVPTGDGCGRQPDPARLQSVAVDRFTARA
jgi:O-succinylbenzoate synthase